MIRKICLVTLAFLLSGCATAYISSETDPRYNLSPAVRVALVIPDSSKIEERKVGAIFEDEMRKSGFNIVDFLEADYWMVVSMDTKTTQITGSMDEAAVKLFGHRVITLSEKEPFRWRKAIEPIIENYMKKTPNGEKHVNRVEELMSKAYTAIRCPVGYYPCDKKCCEKK